MPTFNGKRIGRRVGESSLERGVYTVTVGHMSCQSMYECTTYANALTLERDLSGLTSHIWSLPRMMNSSIVSAMKSFSPRKKKHHRRSIRVAWPEVSLQNQKAESLTHKKTHRSFGRPRITSPHSKILVPDRKKKSQGGSGLPVTAVNYRKIPSGYRMNLKSKIWIQVSRYDHLQKVLIEI
jgi:hypothetical protein